MVLDLGPLDRRAKRWWPALTLGRFELTSPNDPYYNCVAWAMHDKKRWWQPSGQPEHYWPKNAPLAQSVDAYLAAFATRHFEECTEYEDGPEFEKIAIYADADGNFTHVCRQLPDGRWWSKLGEYRDIIHLSLEDLTGEYYGEPVRFMRRPRAFPEKVRRTRAKRRKSA